MKSDKRFGVRGAIFAACLVGSLAFACGGGDENNSGGGDSNASGDSGGGTPAMTAMPAGVGVVKGKVMAAKYKKPSKLPAVTTDKVCSDHFPDGSYVPEKNKMNEDKTLPNVFVYVSKVDGVAPEKKWKFAVPSDTVTIIQEGCQYLPHVVGVMKGQKLSVASKDATQHNVHWMGRKNKFYKNNWIQTKGMEHTDTLKKADREASKPRIRELEARIPELEAAIKLRQEQKEEQKDEED